MKLFILVISPPNAVFIPPPTNLNNLPRLFATVQTCFTISEIKPKAAPARSAKNPLIPYPPTSVSISIVCPSDSFKLLGVTSVPVASAIILASEVP